MFRIEPQLPVTAVKTYTLAAPKSTHFRPANCAEVDCPNHLYGWRTVLDPNTDLGQRQLAYITRDSGRRFTSVALETGLVELTFEAGQQCFTEHQTSRERDPLYVVRDGDWRGNPTGRVRQHTKATDWVDDFATHQDQLADRLQQG